ncbi:hypothetical protein CBS101457_000907 [Exobasidium rhododendri]|nr:hypothetical protein CBS101457_000907 [Exobasidium rhododendri]
MTPQPFESWKMRNDSSAVNASSEIQTTAKGSNTYGTLNQHPDLQQSSGEGSVFSVPFRVGVAEDRNKRWRRTMEDAHAFIYDLGGVRGQGYFSVFDGHAGKHAAEWCGQHFHEYLLDSLINSSGQPVPDLFNQTYHTVDEKLSELADTQGSSSGCTAVTVLLRLEDEEGKPVAHSESGGIDKNSRSTGAVGATAVGEEGSAAKVESTAGAAADGEGLSSEKAHGSGGLLSSFARRIRHGSHNSNSKESDEGKDDPQSKAIETRISKDGLVEAKGKDIRRVLYTANVGDARAVLCRGGKAVRLTYDHKGSDSQEVKRITDAGGFVMNNRVNGVLAVTRSLGDTAMKEFVVGSPYTTETSLSDEDTFLIVACDGLWDVADDQDAVDLIAREVDPQEAAAKLLQHALSNFSTDNTSVMVIRFGVDQSMIAGAAESKSVTTSGAAVAT